MSVDTVLRASWVGVAITAVTRLVLAGRDFVGRPQLDRSATLLLTGVRFHSAAVLAFVGAQADRLFVVSLFDSTNVGYYVVALAYASTGLNVVNGAFGTLLFPEIAAQTEP